MNAARLAARCLEMLGPVAGPVAIACRRPPDLAAALAARARPPAEGEAPAGAIVVWLGTPARPAERQQLLRELQHRLPPAAPLLVVDHNQPRALWRRALGLLPLAAAGLRPARARYPAAREVAALGFIVERLRLASREQIQLVLARQR